MNMRNDDDKERTQFRSERFSLVNGAWYFQTRDQNHGPFNSRENAQAELQNYLVELSALKNFQDSRRLARIIYVTDARNEAKKPAKEPLIEVVEEYRVERRSEERTPDITHLGKKNQSESEMLTSSRGRLTLVPVDR